MKRSSKKYRNPEKKARKKQAKKMIAAGMMVCLGTLPIWCDDEVLLTLFPMGSKSVGSYADVQYDMGVGGKLTWRKNGNLDFFVEGDYKNLTLPNVSSATMINGGVGAGYHLPINDRWGVNFSAQVGGYRASKSDGVLTGLSGGLNISMTYRINSKVSVEAGAAANHYVATPEPLLTDVGATAGLTLNLTKAFSDSTKVSMETKEVLPVFPVLYSWYKNNSFASVGITNEEDAAIENVQVSFYQPQYMSQPNLCATTEKLGKGETFDAELTAFFNESMLDLTEKTNTEASVIIEYTYLGEKKKKTISMVVPVYGRNSMSWDDDRRASVFVSSKDPAALWFSKYISSIVRDNVRMGVSPNIQYAMGIFETLDQFGINYVIDPSSAYSDNVGSTSIDFLQFPYQTLTYRGGDCDDLSILTCSLFEAVGIKTAFITIPGHIFMAFDSGMTINEAKQAMMNTDNMINHDGEAWVPLEITLTDEGFSRAWRTGAREWNQAYKDGTAAFYAMEDSWKIYDPVSVPGAAANFTMPEKEIVSRLFQHSMDEWIAREISPVVAEYNARLAMHDTVELRNELGILYGKYGLFVEADDQFKRARRKGYLPSLLNTANVYFARKQYTIALEWYKKVLEEDSGNELAILGLARCYYELEDYDQCDDAFDIVRHKNPSLASEYTYLGAFEETVGRSYSLADRIALTKWDTGNTSSGITNTGNNSGYDDGYGTEDSNGFVIVDTGDTIIENAHGGEADSLLTQLADLNSSNGMLRPDAVVHEEKKTVLPPDPYAAMDDYNNLVEELPGLLAQLTIPGTNLDEPAPVMVSDTRIASVNATTTPDGGIEEARPTQPKQTEPKKDLSSLINRSNLEPKQTVAAVTPAPAVTQPKVQETPVTVATTATVTQPVVEQTPVTVATTVTVTEPTVATTPVTVATTATVTQPAAVTQPVVEVTPVTVATTAPVTQPTVVQTPVTVATTTPVTQPAAVTQPVVEQTPATVTPTVAVTQPVVEQTPVTVTPTVAVTQPVVETTP
ncbi:MAG: tetratricopeptide repeat protein, partial [Treponema sp.]|nr:tetratricopeptide repeat protein [Treponema sp.]